MKARFEWEIQPIWADGVLRPRCSFSDTPKGFKASLAGLMTDDGGDNTFPYLE